MLDLKHENQKLTLTPYANSRSYLAGMILFLIGFGISYFFGKILYNLHTQNLLDGSLIVIVLFSVFVIGCALMLLGIRSVFKKQKSPSYIFDFAKNEFSTSAHSIRFPLSYISHLEIDCRKGFLNGETRRTRHYQLMLVLKTGEHIWLYTTLSDELMKKTIDDVFNALKLRVIDKTSLKKSRMGKPFDATTPSPLTVKATPSRYVNEKQIPEGTLFTFRAPLPQKQKLAKALGVLVLLGVFGFFFSFVIDPMFPWLLRIFVGLFSFSILGILAFFVLVLTKRREFLLAKPGQLEIYIWFDLPFIKKGHSKKIILKSEELKAWHINYFQEHLYSYLITTAPRQDFGILSQGGGLNTYITKGYNPSQCFTLWLTNSTKAHYQDLLYLRERVLNVLLKTHN